MIVKQDARIIVKNVEMGSFYRLFAVRRRWKPDMKQMSRVMRRLMAAGCEAVDIAPLQTRHVQPLAKGVYACGVYKANWSALFGAR